MKVDPTGIIVWITGLSGAGKTSLARSTAGKLSERGIPAVVLDGDELRQGLCSDLGFSLADRSENVRRAGEVAQLFKKAGFITLVALISPLRDDRRKIREKFSPEDFVEVWCRCPLSVCESRDHKQLYQRARRGEVLHFTGLSSVYENPEAPDLILDTDRLSLENGASLLFNLIWQRLQSEKK